jgi:hypothetical protein
MGCGCNKNKKTPQTEKAQKIQERKQALISLQKKIKK